jgi:polyhydroxyalkanoate synthesis repressor PhaR
MSGASGDDTSSDQRVVKRYSNRKLYDTKDSRYVTLLQIAEMIRAGEEVRIIDNATKEDKTDVTLALIISEELKDRPHAIPVATLKQLIRSREERMVSTRQDATLGRPAKQNPGDPEGETVTSQGSGSFATVGAWQQVIDERIRAMLPNAAGLRDLEQQIRSLNARLAHLEARVASGTSKPEE